MEKNALENNALKKGCFGKRILWKKDALEKGLNGNECFGKKNGKKRKEKNVEEKKWGIKVRKTKVLLGTKVRGTKVRGTKVLLGTKFQGTKVQQAKFRGSKVLPGTKVWETKVLQPLKLLIFKGISSELVEFPFKKYFKSTWCL